MILFIKCQIEIWKQCATEEQDLLPMAVKMYSGLLNLLEFIIQHIVHELDFDQNKDNEEY